MSKIKFPKELREKWLKALRSGKYQQTDGILKSDYDNSYCCLGVCARKLNIPTQELEGVCDFTNDDFMKSKYFKLIPKALVRGGENTKFCEELINMNDTERKSFKEIADYIEKRTVEI